MLAKCHSCPTDFKRATVQTLESHFSSVSHLAKLQVVPIEGVSKSEILHRERLINRFGHFLENDLARLRCKICNLELTSDSQVIQRHENSHAHNDNLCQLNNGTRFSPEIINLSESARLEKAKAIVDKFDCIKMTTEADVEVNRVLEHYKSMPHLQVNSVYCKICSREFQRCDPAAYSDAIRHHLTSKAHKSEVAAAEEKAKRTALPPNGSSLPITPPKKICPRTIDAQDSIEMARYVALENRSYYSVDTTARRSTVQTIHRQVSRTHLLNVGLTLIHNGKFQLIYKPILLISYLHN